MNKSNREEDDFFEIDEGWDDISDTAFTSQQAAKAIKIKSLYQIMYYILHNGRKNTPLHIMTGHNVYDTCKSRELITTLNRVGVSTSYNEVRRARSNLANFCFTSSENSNVPIPRHFVSDKFTLAQMDNFDHQDKSSPSGTKSNHDTVMTLTQIKPEVPPSKPSLKECHFSQTGAEGYDKLPCQKLLPYIRNNKTLPLPETFTVESSNINTDHETKLANQNFLLNYIRATVTVEKETLPTWAGCKSLISTSNLPIMHVAFLPFLPYPVTDHVTVYTALHNFNNVLSQLSQKSLPVVCDEGVFRIVAEITLQMPNELKNLVPMLGTFHLAKAVEHCIGKMMKGSGFQDTFVETKTFGLKTVESVMAGTHYVRALRGLIIISEVIDIMRWEAFWLSRNREDYEVVLKPLDTCKKALQEKNPNEAKKTY